MKQFFIFIITLFVYSPLLPWTGEYANAKEYHKPEPLQYQLFGAPDPNLFNKVDATDTEMKLEDMYNDLNNKKKHLKSSIGVGIVLLGYDKIILELLTLVDYLSTYSTYSIELYYADDISKTNMAILSKYDIKIINLSTHPLYIQKVSNDRKYYLKPLAMLATQFEKVLFLDSDCFPLIHSNANLDSYFDVLNTTDMYFFRDYWMMTPGNPLYKLIEKPYILQRQVDSSVILFRRSKSVNALLLTYSISLDEHFDAYLFGDKDTYWFSALLLRFYRPDILAPKVILNPDMSGYLGRSDCGVGMIHTISNKPSFAHLNGLKSRLTFELKNKVPLYCELNSIYDVLDKNLLNNQFLMANKDNTAEEDGTQGFRLKSDKGQCVTLHDERIFRTPAVLMTQLDLSPILENMEKSFKILQKTC